MGNWRGNWSKLTLEDPADQAFQENLSRWLPNFGAGIYLNSDRWYAGFGCPHLLEFDLRKARNDQGLDRYAKNYRHYYTTLGAAFPLDGEQLVLRPSVLLKSTGWFSSFRQDDDFQNIGAPTELDLDFSIFLHKTFWLGLAYRTALEVRSSSNDSVDFWAAWYLRNGLRFGASYDVGLSRIRTAADRYDFDAAAALISDDLLQRFAFAGTPQQVADQVQAIYAAGASRVELGTPHGLTPQEGLRLLGEQVLPSMRS